MAFEFHAGALSRAAKWAADRGAAIEDELGAGYDGNVFSTARQSAIKSFRYEELYWRERDVCQRLLELGVTRVRQANGPTLLSFDNDFWIVKITIVTPPFVLDFAAASLDRRQNYPVEVIAEWNQEKG